MCLLLIATPFALEAQEHTLTINNWDPQYEVMVQCENFRNLSFIIRSKRSQSLYIDTLYLDMPLTVTSKRGIFIVNTEGCNISCRDYIMFILWDSKRKQYYSVVKDKESKKPAKVNVKDTASKHIRPCLLHTL